MSKFVINVVENRHTQCVEQRKLRKN